MSEFINDLIEQGKLELAVDKEKKFTWEFDKIAGPCSVEGGNVVEIANRIKKCGANAFRAGAYKPCTFPIKKTLNNGWKEGLRKKGIDLLKEAKFSSGLGVLDFMKRNSVIEMNQKSFNSLSEDTQKMSGLEGLDGHKLSVKIRQKK